MIDTCLRTIVLSYHRAYLISLTVFTIFLVLSIFFNFLNFLILWSLTFETKGYIVKMYLWCTSKSPVLGASRDDLSKGSLSKQFLFKKPIRLPSDLGVLHNLLSIGPSRFKNSTFKLSIKLSRMSLYSGNSHNLRVLFCPPNCLLDNSFSKNCNNLILMQKKSFSPCFSKTSIAPCETNF